MGYLTVIVIHNDAMASFKDHPEEFGKAILKGVNLANENMRQVDVPFREYANYISVEPSRHADHETLFMLSGNGFLAIGPYEKDWQTLVDRNPSCSQQFLKRASALLKHAKQYIQKSLNQSP